MAKILFTTWPFPGHVLPHLSIAQALREQGHECAFYTGPRAFERVEGEGFRVFPFRKLDEEDLYKLLFFEQRGFVHSKRLFQFQSTMRRWLLDTVPQQIDDLLPILSEWRPDAIATDPTMWSPILVLHEKYRVPVAVAAYFCCMLPGPGAPPFGLGLPPPRNWYTRLLARGVAFGQNRLTASFRSYASSIRESYGLPPLETSVTAFAGSMPLYLVPSSPEFDYDRHDLPASVRYVGPCIVRERGEGTSTWLATIPRTRPWVHATEGTIHVQDPLVLGAAARGLANLPMEVILTTGGNREPEELELGPIAPNVHVVRWVSHSELLPLVSALITTGGAGSVLASLSAGVPLIVIPTEWDKPEVARRVVESGAGIQLAPGNCTPKRLRAAVQKVLAEPSFRRNAQRLSQAFARYGGPSLAADLLGKLATSGGIPLEHAQTDQKSTR